MLAWPAVLVVWGVRGLRRLGENHPGEHSFGPGSLSTFYTYRLACLSEAINEMCERVTVDSRKSTCRGSLFSNQTIGFAELGFIRQWKNDKDSVNALPIYTIYINNVNLPSCVSRFLFMTSAKRPSLYSQNVHRKPGPIE